MTPDDPLETLRALLVELNLTTLARELSNLLAWAEQNKPSYSELLARALEAERAARWERKVQRRLRWTRLGAVAPLEGFDWAARPQLSPQVIKELMTCRFVEEGRNLILVGKPSTSPSCEPGPRLTPFSEGVCLQE